MQYLFFDIEASEGKSMCSFGYCVTDENFCILEKKDILINPEAIFCTHAWNKEKREKGKGISLAYPESVFKKNPPFSAVYDEINQIISYPDREVIGFSHTNDARYLKTACERYEKPYFSYKFFDVQDVYRAYKGISDQVSLEKIIAEFGVDISNYTLHKSDDDAEISMLVTKALCENLGCGIAELMTKFASYVGETKDGKIIYNGVDSGQAAERRIKKMRQTTLYNFAKAIKINKEAQPSAILGKKFCASAKFEKENFVTALKIIQILADGGARYICNVRDADYYVKFFPKTEGQRGRCEIAEENKRNGQKIKVIEADEFYSLIGMTIDDIDAFSTPKIVKISTQNIAIEKNMRKSKKSKAE